MDYAEYWKEIYEKREELNSLISSYWHHYSNMGTWQFWVVVSLFLFPLILLFFTVDRKRVFEIFFFGYTVNMLWGFFDNVLAKEGYFVHTYFLSPLFSQALNMTTSALPVGFLLLYQYCSNNNKNFYLFTLLLSAIFAFGFASIENYLGFVELRKGMNYFYIFLIDVLIAYIAYWFTKLILKARDRSKT